MPIKFHVDLDDLTWAELETLQECAGGQTDWRQLRALLARFMVDEHGAPVELEQAKAELGALRRNEIGAAIEQIGAALTVPPASGGASSQPSTTGRRRRVG